MVLPAAAALTITNTAITYTDNSEVQVEVSNAEIQVQKATGKGVFAITYNANIVGNPAIDPRMFTADLPPNQQRFYNAFVESGYIVGLDPLCGFWSINWAATGPEAQVLVYSLRTSFDPTAVVDRTISALQVFFNGLVPVVHTDIAYNGNIDETSFGGSASTYYEFTIVAGQDSDRTDHSTLVEGFITTQGLGFNSGNSKVYLLTP